MGERVKGGGLDVQLGLVTPSEARLNITRGSWKKTHKVTGLWVGYGRVSGLEQATNGHGLETQRHDVEAQVAKMGGELVAWFEDTESGIVEKLGSRNGLAELWGTLNALEVEGIVVQRFDRLARDGWVREFMLHELKVNDWQIVSCDDTETDSVFDDDPTRKLLRQMLAAYAEFERGMIRLRTTAGKARKKAAGGFLGGQVPYGWRLGSGGELVDDEHEQDVIAQGLTLRAMGASYASIGEWFLAGGIRLKRANHFHPNVVGRILRTALENGIQPRALTGDARHFLPVVRKPDPFKETR